MSGMRKKRKRRARAPAKKEHRVRKKVATTERADDGDAEKERGEDGDVGDEGNVGEDGDERERASSGDLEPGPGWASGSGSDSDEESDLDSQPTAEWDVASASHRGSHQPGPDPAGELADDPDAELAPAFALEPARLKSVLESLLFASDKPLTLPDLRRLTGIDDTAAIQAALDELVEEYRDRGIPLYDVAGGYQFRTHPQNSEYVQRLIAGRPVRLSRAQLETLAIIAYRQPVTRPEIDDIRGVDSGSTLKVLLDRSLIRVLGKKEEPGRPLLYGTSKEFLEFFNLSELRDLPSLREFHELTDESLREVEALDQSGQEGADQAGADDDAGTGESGSGESGREPDDEGSVAATH